MSAVKAIPPAEIKEQENILYSVSHVEFHAPIRFEGKTEANSSKLPIKAMYWLTNGMLMIKGEKSTHIIPAAAVKDSVI